MAEIRPNHANRLPTLRLADLAQLLASKIECMIPAHLGKLAVSLSDKRLGQTIGAIRKIECVTALVT